MRVRRVAGLVLIGACAMKPVYPSTIAPGVELERAAKALMDAQAAGADSLAGDALTKARTTLAQAQERQRARENDRAAILARMATGEAEYARAVAERELAQRARTEAQKAIEAVPPPGAAR
jgi:hypothetical protein